MTNKWKFTDLCFYVRIRLTELRGIRYSKMAIFLALPGMVPLGDQKYGGNQPTVRDLETSNKAICELVWKKRNSTQKTCPLLLLLLTYYVKFLFEDCLFRGCVRAGPMFSWDLTLCLLVLLPQAPHCMYTRGLLPPLPSMGLFILLLSLW
jgi:hypothetical protein